MSEFKPTLLTESYGELSPGCQVIWKDNLYTLKFGWHINYSNQNIYSWYLVPVKDTIGLLTKTGYDTLSNGIKSYIRTLYKEMIPEISGVKYLPDMEEGE